MSSIFGLSSSDNKNNTYSSIFNNTSSLGDYSLIQSGAYKKLLKAYYNKQETPSSTETEKTEKISLSTSNSDASALNSAVSKLMSREISDDTKEDLKKDLKGVIEKYNSLVDSASKVDNTSVLRQALWMTQGTSAVSATLSDIGVTIGEGNKLSLDEEKFDKASIGTMKTLFEGKDSYMGKLLSRSNLIATASKNAVTGSSSASNYTDSADYKSVELGNIIDTLY